MKPSDVVRFFGAVLEHEIISGSTYGLMTTFEQAVDPQDRYLENFGLGLFAYGDFFGHSYGHLGLFVGSEAVALFSARGEYVLVVLANVSRIRDRDELIGKYLEVIVNAPQPERVDPVDLHE